MIQAIAIDDEPLALNVIRAYCQKIDFVNLTDTFTETLPALEFLKKNKPDLLFLDIQMPAMSGLELYRLLGPEIMVVFTTAYSEYAVEGFNLNALDYLLKPFHFDRFLQALNKAKDYQNFLQAKSQVGIDHFFIRADYSTIKIYFSDIQYIEGLDNYLKIHLEGKRPVVARMSMRTMMEQLPQQQFARIHRSYIVSVSKITAVRNKTIFLDEIELPVGANYADVLLKLQGKS